MSLRLLACKWPFFFLLAGLTVLVVYAGLPFSSHLPYSEYQEPIEEYPVQIASLTRRNRLLAGAKPQGLHSPLRRIPAIQKRVLNNDGLDQGVKEDMDGVDVSKNSMDVVLMQASEETVRDLVFHAVDSIMESSLAMDEIDPHEEEFKKIYPATVPDIIESVALCVIIRDQHADLQEFLVHHYHHLGIRRFYIMDDGSVPALSNYADYSIPRSALTFFYFAPSERAKNGQMQYRAYNTCHSMFGTRHNWLGFIDADEYLEIVDTPGKNMAQFLQDYGSYGALGVSWLIHDSNNRTHKSTESNRKSYTSCIYDGKDSDNKHVKSFVQTKYYVGPTSPHSFRLNESMITVGENFDKIDYAFRPPTRNKIALHHYAVKSREDYEEKKFRGTPTDHRKDDDWCESIPRFKDASFVPLWQHIPFRQFVYST